MPKAPSPSQPFHVHPSITPDRLLEAIDTLDYVGFCLSCGAEASGVEPDATRYTCEACGEAQVYGAEELLLSNLFNQD